MDLGNPVGKWGYEASVAALISNFYKWDFAGPANWGKTDNFGERKCRPPAGNRAFRFSLFCSVFSALVSVFSKLVGVKEVNVCGSDSWSLLA